MRFIEIEITNELLIFSSSYTQTNDLQTIAMKIFDTFPCRNKEQLIIVTQNKDAVLCFMRSARIGFKQNVPKIDKEEIVDTFGGGDAFAGKWIGSFEWKRIMKRGSMKLFIESLHF